METPIPFSQPSILHDGKHYLLKISRDDRTIPVYIQITLLGLTPCPAVVMVEDDRNNRFPCQRGSLFSASGPIPGS